MIQWLGRGLAARLHSLLNHRRARHATIRRLQQQSWFEDLPASKPAKAWREWETHTAGHQGHLPSD